MMVRESGSVLGCLSELGDGNWILDGGVQF